MLSEIHHLILSEMAGRDVPVGQGSIGLQLQSKGVDLSIPTIGRRLQELEFEGLVRKVGVQGRMLTERGGEVLERLRGEALLREMGDALHRTLNRGDRKRILDLLAARRVLEGATAALAAEHVTPPAIATLEALVEQQEASIGRGELGVEADVTFHGEIARASANPVLESLVALLRQNHHYNLAITSVRTAVGGRLIVDHSAILAAIKARDPASARAEMERHLDTLTDELNRYWTESGAPDDPAEVALDSRPSLSA